MAESIFHVICPHASLGEGKPATDKKPVREAVTEPPSQELQQEKTEGKKAWSVMGKEEQQRSSTGGARQRKALLSRQAL